MKKIHILIFALVMIGLGSVLLIKGLGTTPNQIFPSITEEIKETYPNLPTPRSDLGETTNPKNRGINPKIAGASTEIENDSSQEKTEKSLSSNSSNTNDFNNDEEETSTLFLVKRVVDGDTIELDNGEKVRYIGIDTPETVHPDQAAECFGQQASEKNKELVEGKRVRLEKDLTDRDKYGRLLRYVYLEDGTFVNLFLVQEGYATSYTYPPDLKYQNQFQQVETEARQAQRGLWASCQNESQTPSQTSGNCLIKGNISSSGEKIYHLPGQKYYDKTVIDQSKGERWFCSEQEAQSAGWRKSKI